MTNILENLKAILALKLCPGVGNAGLYNLITACGSAEAALKENKNHLLKIAGITEQIAVSIQREIPWKIVDNELNFIIQNRVGYCIASDSNYPYLLKQLDSHPYILFYLGDIGALSSSLSVSVVGTRKATGYGVETTEKIVAELKSCGVNIVSGLATGIDTAAHKAAIVHQIPTFGFIGHGLNIVYPASNKLLAQEMVNHSGALITEFLCSERCSRDNFPRRNRLIAGVSVATIVVEAGEGGGALITAEDARRQNKKVLAVPGRTTDKYSLGCNQLIQHGRATGITKIEEIPQLLGLKKKTQNKISKVISLLSPNEQHVVQILQIKHKASLDEISWETKLSVSNCSEIIFTLEMKEIIRALPGKIYELS